MRKNFRSMPLSRVLALVVLAVASLAAALPPATATAQETQSTVNHSQPANGATAANSSKATETPGTQAQSGTSAIALAVIVGAILIGLAIGLRTIISNLVSGLILRAGRSIKVGDLVSVAGREGRVRSINLRTTEIETDDKASFIIPNTTLITSPVVNRTHRDALARLSVKVPAAYSADPEQVRDVLQKVVADCPLVLPTSASGLTFDGFGPNGYEFSLYAVVSDVSRAREAETDLRFRIVRALRVAGIEMPNPQHDIHLRDLDKLWGLLSRIASERAAARSHMESSAKASTTAAVAENEPPRKKK